MISSAQYLVFTALNIGVFVLCLVALIDLLRRPAAAFVTAGKRTKVFWGVIVGIATAVVFVQLPPTGRGNLGLLGIVSAVAAIVYLVDVKPAVAPYSGRGGGPGRGPGRW
ncbi:DUF2516 family protein [Cellulomonas bogoriensis]|uniref:DUF2516 domain-containing protein n=1 Tax=Cellulomonas bogoriensis 69B4 = DSM 16987 TaxID=1386082 RepID=A0A0A0BP88_9CELL|nr:DUF2516 family protein [Cellulomonas bogoriensis]KGM09755.1 hypothetical protein N869_05995 [Cellulomonas bogoriensis 69B4 = DSM 16987]